MLFALRRGPGVRSGIRTGLFHAAGAVGGFAMGPLAALLILLIKDLTGLLHSNSMGVGEIAIS